MTHPVTAHAVWRWLERFHGLGPAIAAAVPSDAHDADRAEFGCRLLGITMAEARRRILPDRLRPWLDSGATAIVANQCRLVVEAGIVVTVIGPVKKMKRRRWQAEIDMEIAA